MVSEDRIREEEMDTDEYLDKSFISPEEATTEVYWPDYWDDYPEEQPGENTRIEDSEEYGRELCWEQDGFEVRLRSTSEGPDPFGYWVARVTIPDEVGQMYFDEHMLRINHAPNLGNDHKMGYIFNVEMSEGGYITKRFETRVREVEGMPTTCIKGLVRDLREAHEEHQEHAEEIQNNLDVARQYNE